MALNDWRLMDQKINHKSKVVRKIWVKKSDREQQLDLTTIMPYAHVLSFMGWQGKSLGTYKTFEEGEKKAKQYMESH